MDNNRHDWIKLSAQRGMFIVLEGGEGTGKSTQARRLAESLEGVFTYEPGDTSIGSTIRSWLLSPDTQEIAPMAEMLLMAADRAQHVFEVIEPSLASGIDVVCDRYIPSSIAYQSVGRGIDLYDVKHVSHVAAVGVEPDLYVLLDTPYETARARLDESKADRFEQLGEDFHRAIFDSYRSQAAKDPKTWAVVDASLGEDLVHKQIVGAVKARRRRLQASQNQYSVYEGAVPASQEELEQAMKENRYDC